MTRSTLSASHRSRRWLSVPFVITLGGAVIGWGAAPASASTAQLEQAGGMLTYQAGAGEVNDVTITQANDGTFTITDPGASIATGEGCDSNGATATCSGGPATYVYMTLLDGADTASIDIDVASTLDVGDGDDTMTLVAARAYVYGAGGDDVLTTDTDATQMNATYVSGADGDDIVTALSGPTLLDGGKGDDDLTGGPSGDQITTGAGADRVSARAGNDSVFANDNSAVGDDTVYLGVGDDVFYDGVGNQDARGGGGIDTSNYYDYDSTVADLVVSLDDAANDGEPATGEHDNIHADFETVITGGGDDTLIGSETADTLHASSGNDVVSGLGGRDRLHGGSGEDLAAGGAGDDRIAGEAGNDTVEGGEGDDYLDGSDVHGDDILSGGTGLDFVAFDRANNVTVTLDDLPNDGTAREADNVRSDVEDVATGAGNDTIIGAAAANDLSGGAGHDILRGGDGNDGLDGDLGRDKLGGGSGTDSISGGGSVDTIRTQDHSADYVTCGSSIDSLNRDRRDQVAVDCEHLS